MFSAAGKSAVTSGYNINNSLRLRSSASAYLNRTFTTPTNNKIWTWSGWVKRGALASYYTLFSPASSGTGYTVIRFTQNANDDLAIFQFNGSSYDYHFATSQLFRDPAAWYHIVVAMDTTQATNTNRMKLYVNGNQVTAFSSSPVPVTYPTQNLNTNINSAVVHRVGAGNYTGNVEQPFDGYLADVYFVDGQQLTPSSFGETDGTTGVWKPKRFGGSFGTNGFYLPFSDIATTSGSNTGLGKDFSGNGNYWTTNNISVTSGTTYDAMLDSPTNTSATVANYATLNPVTNGGGTYSNGNLQFTGPTNWVNSLSTIEIPSTGKFYAEATLTGTAQDNNQGNSYAYFGVRPTTASATTAALTDGNVLAVSDTGWYYNFVAFPSGTNIGSRFVTGDVIGLAIDRTANTYTFYKNNISFSSGTINYTSGNPLSFVYGSYSSSYGQMAVNFGQRPFTYTPPSGFVALNTFNLAESTIKKGSSYMDATTYTGTGSAQNITNSASMQPDLIWIKARNAVSYHGLTDSVRGRAYPLFSNATDAEGTSASDKDITSFNSNGFSLGVGNQYNSNGNGNTFVAWQWRAGSGTTTINTSGTISSNVSVSSTAGFSVIGYTGTGSAGTIGHGLGVAPKMVIVKSRTTAGDEWCVWHTSLTNATYYLYLNSTATQAVDVNFWNSTAPSSTVVTLGSNVRTNRSGGSFICYAWAEIAGFSKFGSYTGNGSTDGTFVYTGFRPKYILIKRINLTEDWYIYDTSRITYNLGNIFIYADLTDAENTGATGIDILSNGFKQRQTGGGNNASGSTYIYAAYAENPFKNALAR